VTGDAQIDAALAKAQAAAPSGVSGGEGALRRARRASAHADELARERDLAVEAFDVTDPATIPDDRLRLIFTCCHPALSADGRVALTLRMIGGLTTAEIARAFLASEATIAQRLVRAKRTIREHEIPYEVPAAGELSERLPAVLAVIYLIFNEGYAAHTGDALVRDDLCSEAIRLGGMLAGLMPGEPEVLGLLALMELQASRFAARMDANGDLVLLADQDRRRWDRGRIERGLACLDALPEAAGPCQLQAMIAACHARAASWEATDWARIIALYDRLGDLTPSPVVALNRAAAIGMAHGAEAGLAALDALDSDALKGYRFLPSTRGDFLRRLERWGEAAACYREALGMVENASERRFLTGRLEECEGRGTLPREN
jgi:RNA polymerase sigma-70 factor (ECF subfamily)